MQGAPQRPDAQQRRQIPLLRRGVPAHPEGEEPGGKGGQGQLGDKADDPGEPPALFRQIDESGQRPHQGGAQGHEKPGGVEFQVIEGEGHRVDQDGRGGVAKGVHQRLGEHIAHDRPHQGAEAPGSRSGGGQIAQRERGAAVQHVPRRQHRAHQRPNGTLRRQRRPLPPRPALRRPRPLRLPPAFPGFHTLVPLVVIALSIGGFFCGRGREICRAESDRV